MNKQQVDHLLRAAGRILAAKGKGKRFVIIGSQALHGKFPNFPDQLVRSIELDLFEIDDDEATGMLEAIGRDSPFHEEYGYYADPVSIGTAVLPKGWKSRLVNLPAGDTDGAKGLCLEPHDLAISKYAAGRDKDREFLAGMVSFNMLDKDLLMKRIAVTPIDEEKRATIVAAIERDFTQRLSKPARPLKK